MTVLIGGLYHLNVSSMHDVTRATETAVPSHASSQIHRVCPAIQDNVRQAHHPAGDALAIVVTGRVIASRRHVEDATRTLYYFHPTNISKRVVVQYSTPGSPVAPQSTATSQALHSKLHQAVGGGACGSGTCTHVSPCTPAPIAAVESGTSSPSHPSMHSFSLSAQPVPVSASGYSALLPTRSVAGSSSHRSNRLTRTANAFCSSDGYVYRYHGWYDEQELAAAEPRHWGCERARRGGEDARRQHSTRRHVSVGAPKRSQSRSRSDDDDDDERGPVMNQDGSATQCVADDVEGDEKGNTFAIPDSWLDAMEKASAVCEVRYLCYVLRPWFDSPFHSLGYLSLPERNCCYSVYLCHRCLSPFVTARHLAIHLEGEYGQYCAMYSPPGPVLYHDQNSGHKTYFVDGMQHMHYARCLTLLGKCFIESKLLHNDVDIYEYFVLTVPRAALPYQPTETQQQRRHRNENYDNDNRSNVDHYDDTCTSNRGTDYSGGGSAKNSSYRRGYDLHGGRHDGDRATSQSRLKHTQRVNAHDGDAGDGREDLFEDEKSFRAVAARYDAGMWSGDVVAGYFSRLKHRPHHTLSCIVTLPIFQHGRLAHFMLDVAYTFMRVRQQLCGCALRCGSGDRGGAISRPFSPCGQELLLTYWGAALRRSMWRCVSHNSSSSSSSAFSVASSSSLIAASCVPPSPDADHTVALYAAGNRWKSSSGGSPCAHTYSSLDDISAMMDIPIHRDDLLFLLLHDECVFYASAEGGRRSARYKTSTPRGLTTPSERTVTSVIPSDSHSSSRVVSLVFDKTEVARQAAQMGERGRTGGTALTEHALPWRATFDERWLCKNKKTGELLYSSTLFHHA